MCHADLRTHAERLVREIDRYYNYSVGKRTALRFNSRKERRSAAFLDVSIETAVGPLKFKEVTGLVMHAEMAEILIGKTLLAQLELDGVIPLEVSAETILES